MKKIFFGFMGMLLAVAGANAADTVIKAATNNTVAKSVYDVEYGSAATADLDTYGYRKGVLPQGKKLSTVTGAAVTVNNSATSGQAGYVAIGSLASNDATINANQANIQVLERDKLVKPGTGNCASGDACGYVTVGDNNNTTDKVWMKIAKCTTNSQTGVTTCTGD